MSDTYTIEVPNLYNFAVFLSIVTSNGKEWQTSLPSYILEKSHILKLDERDAWGFGYLDVKNMRRAVEYLQAWHIEIPEPWKQELKLQLQAAEEWAREVQADYLQS